MYILALPHRALLEQLDARNKEAEESQTAWADKVEALEGTVANFHKDLASARNQIAVCTVLHDVVGWLCSSYSRAVAPATFCIRICDVRATRPAASTT